MSRPYQASRLPVAQACALLSEWTGLELRGTAPKRVDEFLRTRATQLGYVSKDAYVQHLHDLDPRDEESQRLINLVTNGLTAFWRDLPQLDALQTVFAKLADSRSESHPVNVWCAGCSSGEEAYTVAMIAAEEGVPVHVLGSDLNTESLGHARDGIYGEWSLRRTEPARRERFFTATDDGRQRIAQELKASVDFAHHNILEAPPKPPSGDKWDVIMCRNVLIYFSTEAIKNVLRHFSDRIHKDGYLLLGSSEQLHTGNIPVALVPFRAARQGGGFVYRLRETPPGQTVAFPPREEPEPDPEEDFPTLDLQYQPSLEEETSDITSEVTDHQAAHNLLDRAVAHLEEGRTEAALACCEATASYDPFVPETYCLMAYMLARQGARAQAADTYRKVLFLDPFNWVAAVESARLYMRQKDAGRAKRALRQAVEGLHSGRALSPGMKQICAAMDRAITDREAAEAFCKQYIERLRGQKFLD